LVPGLKFFSCLDSYRDKKVVGVFVQKCAASAGVPLTLVFCFWGHENCTINNLVVANNLRELKTSYSN
jgi:hypothetical protein